MEMGRHSHAGHELIVGQRHVGIGAVHSSWTTRAATNQMSNAEGRWTSAAAATRRRWIGSVSRA